MKDKMKSVEFCYWLQGYFEILDDKTPALTPTQVGIIQKHLNMVFVHEIDPSYKDSVKLSAMHNSPKSDWTMRC